MLLFDIGANIGRWALANVLESNTIVSIEASPHTYVDLIKNVRGHKNIHTLHYAVCPSKESHIVFYHCREAHTLSTLNKDWLSSPQSRFESYKNTITEVTVPTISIDKLIEKFGVPDLVKVDVEGAENIVLQSLTQKVPLLCFEWASEWKTQNRECVEYLTSLGFKQFAIQYEDKYTYRPVAFDLSAEDIFAMLDKTTPKLEWGMIWAR